MAEFIIPIPFSISAGCWLEESRVVLFSSLNGKCFNDVSGMSGLLIDLLLEKVEQ